MVPSMDSPPGVVGFYGDLLSNIVCQITMAFSIKRHGIEEPLKLVIYSYCSRDQIHINSAIITVNNRVTLIKYDLGFKKHTQLPTRMLNP